MADTPTKRETLTRRSSFQIPSSPCGSSLTASFNSLHTDGFTPTNSAILEAMPMLDIHLAPQNDSRRDLILSLPNQIDDRTMPSDVADSIRGLWMDPGVKEAVRRAREFQLNDSAV